MYYSKRTVGLLNFKIVSKSFNKPYLTSEEQIKLLTDRGMVIPDYNHAKHSLDNIGYYRLSGYFYLMKENSDPISKFKINSSFSDVINLYNFDQKLRFIMIEILEKIEIALRSNISQIFGKINSFAYIDPLFYKKKFKDSDKFSKLQSTINNKFNKSNEDFVKSFLEKYQDNPPIWISSGIWDFGILATVIGGIEYRYLKQLAEFYNISDPTLIPSWVYSLNHVRNICAHYGRLWNRNLTREPKYPQKFNLPILNHLFYLKKSSIYSVAAIAKYFEKIIDPNSIWKDNFIKIIVDFPKTSHFQLSNFPENWHNLDLWR